MKMRISIVVLVLALFVLAGYRQAKPQSQSTFNGFDLVGKTGNIRKPASNGREAIQQFRAHRPDVTLMIGLKRGIIEFSHFRTSKEVFCSDSFSGLAARANNFVRFVNTLLNIPRAVSTEIATTRRRFCRFHDTSITQT